MIPIAITLIISLISSVKLYTFSWRYLIDSCLSFSFEHSTTFAFEPSFEKLLLPLPFDFLGFRFLVRFRCWLLDSQPVMDCSEVAEDGSTRTAGDFVSLHVFVDSYQDDADGELELAALLEDLDSTVTGLGSVITTNCCSMEC